MKTPIKLTKQAIGRLLDNPIEVRTTNGNFKRAEVRASFSRYTVELRVNKSHPLLEWVSGYRNEVELTYWKSHEGFQMEIPKELEPLVDSMKQFATMSDEEAQQIDQETRQAIADFYNL